MKNFGCGVSKISSTLFALRHSSIAANFDSARDPNVFKKSGQRGSSLVDMTLNRNVNEEKKTSVQTIFTKIYASTDLVSCNTITVAV
jgi:hypothetical protein